MTRHIALPNKIGGLLMKKKGRMDIESMIRRICYKRGLIFLVINNQMNHQCILGTSQTNHGIEQDKIGGMSWMRWKCLGWNEVELNQMEWNGVGGWSGVRGSGMECNGVKWNGVEWDRMGWG